MQSKAAPPWPGRRGPEALGTGTAASSGQCKISQCMWLTRAGSGAVCKGVHNRMAQLSAQGVPGISHGGLGCRLSCISPLHGTTAVTGLMPLHRLTLPRDSHPPQGADMAADRQARSSQVNALSDLISADLPVTSLARCCSPSGRTVCCPGKRRRFRGPLKGRTRQPASKLSPDRWKEELPAKASHKALHCTSPGTCFLLTFLHGFTAAPPTPALEQPLTAAVASGPK